MHCIDELRTKHLTLRRISSLDVEIVRALHSESRVMAMIGGTRPVEFTQSEVEKMSQHWAQHGFGPWIVRDAISNRFVGIGGLFQARIEETQEIELGYMLIPEFWGQGLATEVARASVHIGFSILNLPSLVSFAVPTNLPSLRIMEKLGFAFERDFRDKNGVPQVLYRLVPAMWSGSAGTVQ